MSESSLVLRRSKSVSVEQWPLQYTMDEHCSAEQSLTMSVVAEVLGTIVEAGRAAAGSHSLKRTEALQKTFQRA